MSQKGWVGWALSNRIAALGFALCLLVASADLGVIAARSGGDDSTSDEVVAGPEDDEVDGDSTTTTPDTLAPGETTTTQAGGGPGGPTRTTQRGATATTAAPGPTVPGDPGTPCTPDPDHKATGIDSKKVVIGQIVSDVSVLPAQLFPNHEGLAAYIKMVNDAGGVCGRKIEVKYSNDNANPATHDYESMTHEVFAFVANSSLIDGSDYEDNKPFNPRFKDNGEFVPDVGGLAYSYPRNQSLMFAGVIGSLSPSLVGGGAVKVMIEEVAAKGKPCKKAGVVYLREPTGASEDSARVGGVALAADWGGNFGSANVKFYVANLADPEPVYGGMVTQMVGDGVNCVFTYMDLGSNINLVKAMRGQGVWPPGSCNRGPQCFSITYMPFAGYDPKFIRDAGPAAQDVTTFLPHIPLNETGNAPMQTYLKALKAYSNDAEPSTFSIIGWTSGVMFVEALRACGAAPTRACLMDHLRALQNFDGGGLLAPTTPFRSTRVRCDGDCGNFRHSGVFDWTWIFNCWAMVRVRGDDFHRILPESGFRCDEMRVARGTPA